MPYISEPLKDAVRETEHRLWKRPVLQSMYARCFLNTLETTVEKCDDGSIYMITGDIPAMWLRDSSAQVRQYLAYASQDATLRDVLAGVIKKQFSYISIDPYANAFNKEPNGNGHSDDITDMSPWVWERKYEIDSLCYPIQLIYLYWKAVNRTDIFDENLKRDFKNILRLWKTEQRHGEESPYHFANPKRPWHDTIHNNGMGAPVNVTGMTWSGFRPSDDACVFGYFLPSNMFAVVALRFMEEIAQEVYHDEVLREEARTLSAGIDNGIQTYGVVRHPKYGPMFACETDGFGNHRLMDDANIPSLLSVPYLGYADSADEVYQNTRRFVLSRDNPYYFEGKYARGIGSPHTPKGYIWHLSLVMQALTSNDPNEINEVLSFLENTHAGTGYMHEGFDANNPTSFTRPWFAWANSLFAELIQKLVNTTDIFL